MENFYFQPKDCNKVYFNELLLLLNAINPDKEKFKRIPKKEMTRFIKKLNIKCEHDFNSCDPDEFFFEDKKQIILGRFYHTIGCFYSCKGHYFNMEMEPYSIFKNDVFIRYIIDKPELYINNSTKIELEHVFPVRILIGKNQDIFTYADKKMESLSEYTFNSLGISKDNLKILHDLPETSILKKVITKSQIISREMCILYFMKLHFYVVDGKNFILVSKYNLQQLREIYKKKNRMFPSIHYLFKPKQTKRVRR